MYYKQNSYALIFLFSILLLLLTSCGGGGGGDNDTSGDSSGNDTNTISVDLNRDSALAADTVITFEMKGDVTGNVLAGIANHDADDHLFIIGDQSNDAISSIEYIRYEQTVNGITYGVNYELDSNGLPLKMYVDSGDYALLSNWTDSSVDVTGYDANGTQNQPPVTVLLSPTEIQRLMSLSRDLAYTQSSANYVYRIDNPVLNNPSRAFEAISLGANIFGCAVSGITAAAAWGFTPFTAGTSAAIAIPLTAAATMSCGSLAVSTAAAVTDEQWIDTTAALMDTVGCSLGSVSSCTAYVSDWSSIATSPTNPQTKIISPTSDGDITINTGDVFTLIAIVNTYYGDVVDATWDFGDGNTFSDMEEEVDYAFNNAGTYTISFTITYDVGTVVSDRLIVTVADSNPPENLSPSVNAGLDQAVTSGSSVSLTGSASDSDGTVTQYQWSQLSGTNVTLYDSNTISATFTAPTVTTDTSLTFRFTATDNDSASSSDNVVITIKAPNQVDDTIGGLLAYYEFEGTATDSSGNDNHGTEYNGISYSSGVIGNAVDFDGVEDYITLQTTDILFNSTAPPEISVSFWGQIHDTDTTASIINSYDSSSRDNQFPINIKRHSTNRFFASVRHSSISSGTTEITYDDGTIIRPNEWHHIGYTFSQSTGQIKGYIDGVLISSDQISTTGDYTDNDPIYLGAVRFQGVIQQHFNGKIDELRIYGRSLSDDEIALLAGNISPPELPPADPPPADPPPADPPASTIDISGAWNVNGRYSDCATSAQATVTYDVVFGSVTSMVLSGDVWHHDCTITQLTDPVTVALSSLSISNPVNSSDYQLIQQTFSDVVSGDTASHTTTITSFAETSIGVQFFDTRDSSIEIVNYTRQ